MQVEGFKNELALERAARETLKETSTQALALERAQREAAVLAAKLETTKQYVDLITSSGYQRMRDLAADRNAELRGDSQKDASQ
jgi:hypothetical protein